MSEWAKELFARLVAAEMTERLTDAGLDALCAYAIRCDAATQRAYLSRAAPSRDLVGLAQRERG